MILILSNEMDISSAKIIEILDFYGEEVVRINGDSSDFILSEINENEILFRRKSDNRIFNILDSKSCWWRRTAFTYKTLSSKVQNDKFLSKLDFDVPMINQYIASELSALKAYISYRLYNKVLTNIGSPNYDINKLVTLEIAAQCGLCVPPYEIITNTNQILSKKTKVTKAISNGIYDTVKNHNFYSYTEKYDNQFNNTSVFPSIIMDMVNKKYEIRTFYLCDKFYSMAIFSQTNNQTSIDFRKYDIKYPNRTEPYILPKRIENKLRKLFKILSLNTGSIDLILDENGNYIFLEINPVGQFDMVSLPCNYNLEEIIAKYLINGKH